MINQKYLQAYYSKAFGLFANLLKIESYIKIF